MQKSARSMARRKKSDSKDSTDIQEGWKSPKTYRGPKVNGLPDDSSNGTVESDDSHDEDDVKLSYSYQASKESSMSPSTTVVHKKFGKISCLPPETQSDDPNMDSESSSQDQVDDSNVGDEEDQRVEDTSDNAELLEVVLAHEQVESGLEDVDGMEDNDTETIVVEVEEGMVDELDNQDTVIVQVVGEDLMYTEDGETIWELETVEEVDNDGDLHEEVVLMEKDENSVSMEDLATSENSEELAVNSVTSSGITEKGDGFDGESLSSHVGQQPTALDSDLSDREVEDESALRSRLSPEEITQMVLGLNCGSADVAVEHQMCASKVDHQESAVTNQHRESVITRRSSDDLDMDMEVNSRLKGNPMYVYGNPKKNKSPTAKTSESCIVKTSNEMVTPPRRKIVCIDDSPLKSPSLGESPGHSKRDDFSSNELPISSIGGSLFNVDLNSVTHKKDSHDKTSHKEQLGAGGIEPIVKKCKSSEGDFDAKKSNQLRNRSGSSDTAGSDSGSRSPTVRRSSRIRTPNAVKKQSVTKTSSESGDSSKENPSSSSSVSSVRQSMITAPIPDVSMPVKVKSRWRRSSELEMGGMGTSDNDVGTTVPSPSQPPEPPSSCVTSSSGRSLSDKELKARREEELQELADRLKGYEILNENLYLTERYVSDYDVNYVTGQMLLLSPQLSLKYHSCILLKFCCSLFAGSKARRPNEWFVTAH